MASVITSDNGNKNPSQSGLHVEVETATPSSTGGGEFAAVEDDGSGGDNDDASSVFHSVAEASSGTRGTAGSSSSIRSVVRFLDDPSLQQPSSTVRFRSSSLRIIEQAGSQLVLEEKLGGGCGGGDVVEGGETSKEEEDGHGGKEKGRSRRRDVTVRTVESGTFSHLLLRSLYSLVTVFFGGFLFIFSVQLVLFLFMDIVTDAKASNSPAKANTRLVSAIFSLPVFVHGLSSAMTIATSFAVDTWRGHRLSRWIGRENKGYLFSSITSEWISFSVYIAVPALTAIVTLFAGYDNWWAITLYSWYVTIFCFWCIYAAIVFQYEIRTCLALVRQMDGTLTSPLSVVRTAIHLIQSRRWSGYTQSTYLINSRLALDTTLRWNPDGYKAAPGVKPNRTRTSLFTRLTQSASCAFTTLDVPKRQTTFQDLRGDAPVVTANSWSLEKVYCGNQESQAIVVVTGPSAVSKGQRNSSFLCVAIGNTLVILALAGLLAWMDMGAVVIVMIVLVIVLCCVPNIRTMIRTYQMYRDIVTEEQRKAKEEERFEDEEDQMGQHRDGDAENDAVYQVSETFRITRPRDGLVWCTFSFDMVFFYLWPLIAFFVIGNVLGGCIFLILCIFSGARRYLNAVNVLKELGSLEYLDGVVTELYGSAPTSDSGGGSAEGDADSELQHWKTKSRIIDILGHISRGGVRDLWRAIFWGLAIVLGVLSCFAVFTATRQNSSIAEMQGSLSDFYYEKQLDLSYPTCELKKGFQILDSRGKALEDFAYLAGVVYNPPAFRQDFLNKWFGEGFALDNKNVVDDFQKTFYPKSPMRYMLTTFPGTRVAVVTIRGTVNFLDMFTDAQLWAGAGLAQLLRSVMPIGSIWTPVLQRLVTLNNAVETDSLNERAYYKEIADFLQTVMKSRDLKSVIVTGHSLGGGVAMIAGPQTGIRAVGISGPNSMLSRDSVDPPITKEQLDSLTFNVIPDRDLVPMIDDRARLFQQIECRAPINNPLACHDVLRTICDIQYHCGSGGRPALCSCAIKFEYPPPIQNGTRTFTEACIEEYPEYEGQL